MKIQRGSVGATGLSAVLAMLLVTLGACKREAEKAEEPVKWPEIPGYAAMSIPADNPMTRAKVELGKQLYYDARLSGDGSRSCYSCHLQEYGLTDGKPKAIGSYNVELPRRSPTLWNIGYHSEFYWDGRSSSLEAQAKAAWTGGNMGVSGRDGRPSTEDICRKLMAVEGYARQFRDVFGEAGCTADTVVKAIAAFERTIVIPADSAWIRFRQGDETAFSEDARRGWQIFSGKARCTNCHDGLLLTDLQYHNVGIGWDAKAKEMRDKGRFAVTAQDKDTGAFKTPTLLDVARRTHFFHDGSADSLEKAVDIMLAGGIKNPYLDTANLQPVKLTAQERSDLLAFLRALNVEYSIPPPPLP
jgi:cytochrome c peroxidase